MPGMRDMIINKTDTFPALVKLTSFWEKNKKLCMCNVKSVGYEYNEEKSNG